MASEKDENGKLKIDPTDAEVVNAYRYGYNKGFEDGCQCSEKRLGWHPASEVPPVDENGNSPELIAITSDDFLMRVYFNQESKEYSYGVNVKWWCYPPKED